MGRSLWPKACLVVAVALAAAGQAQASASVSPPVSTNGAFTVAWTDTSGGVVRAYLAQSTNGGAWAKTTVTGTLSKAYTGKAIGTYAYKVQIYLYGLELKKELFDHETNVATVQVTTLTAPGAPGAVTGPERSESGAYRAILQRFGIGVDNAANGLFMPGGVHARIHTNAYFEAVNEALGQATTREEAVRALNTIREGIIRGTFP